MHVQHIDTALQEMKRVLKPGGVLAVEDGDFSTPFCDPPNVAFARCIELYRAIGEQHNEDFLLGRKLYRLVRAAGFREVEAALVQPLFTRGEAKRLPEWTLAEAAPALIEAGLTTQVEVDSLVAEMATFAADENTVVGMARMMQVCARK